jgi:hypothetical protein
MLNDSLDLSLEHFIAFIPTWLIQNLLYAHIRRNLHQRILSQRYHLHFPTSSYLITSLQSLYKCILTKRLHHYYLSDSLLNRWRYHVKELYHFLLLFT